MPINKSKPISNCIVFFFCNYLCIFLKLLAHIPCIIPIYLPGTVLVSKIYVKSELFKDAVRDPEQKKSFRASPSQRTAKGRQRVAEREPKGPNTDESQEISMRIQDKTRHLYNIYKISY